MNHTPGPWECPNLDDDYSSRQGWITTKEGTLIAAMEPSDNQESDARLIAAAPELLEHLTWIANHDGECVADWPRRLAAIRAGIARATGAIA